MIKINYYLVCTLNTEHWQITKQTHRFSFCLLLLLLLLLLMILEILLINFISLFIFWLNYLNWFTDLYVVVFYIFFSICLLSILKSLIIRERVYTDQLHFTTVSLKKIWAKLLNPERIFIYKIATQKMQNKYKIKLQ